MEIFAVRVVDEAGTVHLTEEVRAPFISVSKRNIGAGYVRTYVRTYTVTEEARLVNKDDDDDCTID